MQGQISHPHLATPTSDAVTNRSVKKRGGYNCGRCGLPKKGHVCTFQNPNPPLLLTSTPSNTSVTKSSTLISSSLSVIRQSMNHGTWHPSHFRRALSFDDVDLEVEKEAENEVMEKKEDELADCSYLFELLRRLPPKALLAAGGVCREWREVVKMIWKEAEEVRVRVPVDAPVGFVGSVLNKCGCLVRLSLRMERDMDSMTLACIAFSCPNLESLDIFMFGAAVNRITGEDLGRFVVDRRRLSNLKLEGCSNVGALVFSSTSLGKLWLSDLHNVSKMVFNCPNLSEISLDFSRQGNDSTDLATMVGCLGRSCPRLQKLNIASVQLSNAVVLALTAANLRGLRMLSLVLGSEITDASVAAIASVYSSLELLDLSGSSITDSGIGMICNVFPETLTRLLLAVCPKITSSGIQFAAAQLPLLELMDCGMTICDPNCESETTQDHIDREIPRTPNAKLHLIYQKLIIKHSRLKKLSLWGCSGLDVRSQISIFGVYFPTNNGRCLSHLELSCRLYILNCPQLSDLNLNSCIHLHPESLLLQCPNLESVHAAGCEDMLVDSIQSQVCDNNSAMQSNFSSKRLPDGSKRVQAHFLSEQPDDDAKKRRRVSKGTCAVLRN